MDKVEFVPIAIEALVPELLGLDSIAIAGMAQVQPEAAVGSLAVSHGLNRFMRKALAGYLALADLDGVAVRLKDEASARANGWPDARTANVAMMLAWALLAEDRELKGLSPVPLFTPEPAHVALDPVMEGADDLSGRELCRRVLSGITLTADMQLRRQRGIAPPADGPHVPSTNACISDILGLDPAALEADYKIRARAGMPEVDAGTQVRLALHLVVRGALDQYQTMDDRGVEEIRLMTEQDALDARRPDARAANLAALLSTALLCEDGFEPVIYPPRDHGPDYEALLRQVAAFAARDGSRQACAALEALVERDVHFGRTWWPGKHDHLLHEAFKQLDAQTAD